MAMAEQVTIRIGGLVMYCQPTVAAQCLYVFFVPSMMHPHVPVFSPEIEIRPRKADINFTNQFVDLRNDLVGGSAPATLSRLVRASKLTGKSVDPKYFYGLEGLPACLILPYPTSDPTPVNAVEAKWRKGTGNPTNIGKVTGTLEFTYTWKNSTLNVLGEPIKPGALIDFEHASQRRPPRRTPVNHRMHDTEQLLTFLDKTHGIELQTDEIYEPKGILGASPVECASGGGCEPPLIDC